MNLGFSEEQELLRRSARELFSRAGFPALDRDLERARQTWREVAQLGWLGLALPERYGGGGGELVDLSVVYEEAGRALVPGLQSAAVDAGRAIWHGGSDQQRDELLPHIAGGPPDTLLVGDGGRWGDGIEAPPPRISLDGPCVVLDGTVPFVAGATTATRFLVAAAGPDGGTTLVLVPAADAQVTVDALETFDRLATDSVSFTSVRLPADAVVGTPGGAGPPLRQSLQEAVALQCAEMVGGAQAVLDMTSRYVGERIQFGRPIGTFQSVQHHIANTAIAVDGARYATYQALWKLERGDNASAEVAIAKVATARAYVHATEIGHELHGGYGYVTDHPLHRHSERARVAALSLGTPHDHLGDLCASLGLADGAVA